MIEVIVSPCPRGRYRMSVHARDYGASRTPLFTAARMLLAEGYEPNTVLQLRHAGSSIPSLRGPLAALAVLTVIENKERGPVIGRYRSAAKTRQFRASPEEPAASKPRAAAE